VRRGLADTHALRCGDIRADEARHERAVEHTREELRAKLAGWLTEPS
jgi:hypothetical protein